MICWQWNVVQMPVDISVDDSLLKIDPCSTSEISYNKTNSRKSTFFLQKNTSEPKHERTIAPLLGNERVFMP